jgi:hypothetical protein
MQVNAILTLLTFKRHHGVQFCRFVFESVLFCRKKTANDVPVPSSHTAPMLLELQKLALLTILSSEAERTIHVQ